MKTWHLSAFYLGLLAALLTHLLLELWLVFSRDINPGGGIGVAHRGGWFFAWFCWFVMSNCELATLLVTRLGSMPCSAWSKRKSVSYVFPRVEGTGWPGGVSFSWLQALAALPKCYANGVAGFALLRGSSDKLGTIQRRLATGTLSPVHASCYLTCLTTEIGISTFSLLAGSFFWFS